MVIFTVYCEDPAEAPCNVGGEGEDLVSTCWAVLDPADTEPDPPTRLTEGDVADEDRDPPLTAEEPDPFTVDDEADPLLAAGERGSTPSAAVKKPDPLLVEGSVPELGAEELSTLPACEELGRTEPLLAGPPSVPPLLAVRAVS